MEFAVESKTVSPLAIIINIHPDDNFFRLLMHAAAMNAARDHEEVPEVLRVAQPSVASLLNANHLHPLLEILCNELPT